MSAPEPSTPTSGPPAPETPRPPESVEGLTAQWLRAALGGVPDFEADAIERIRLERIGEGRGFTSHVLRVHLEPAPQGGLPRSLVAKLSAPAGPSRELIKGAYERESIYYRRFEPESPFPAPRCYHAAYEPTDGRFVLLLEDLQGFEGGDQLAGTSDVRAEAAIIHLARLHAHFWNDPRVSEALGPIRDDVDFGDATALFVEGVKELGRTRGGRYPRVVQVAESIERLLGTPGLDPARMRAPRPPLTLLHGDYRLDNLFFSDDPARPLIAIDWVIRAGRAGVDLGYFMVGSLTPDQLRRRGRDLMRLYHRTLCEHGVSDYGFRRLVADYEMVLGQMVAHQVLVQVMLARSRGEAGAGDSRASELENRLRAFFSDFADTERGAPLFEAMIERVEAALELHPRVRDRLRFARWAVATRSLLRGLLGRG